MSDETRARLLELATNMFSELGFHGTSVRQLCKTAEVNVAAVNYHFGSKEKLWEEAHTALNARMLAYARESIRPGMASPEAVRRYLSGMFDYLLGDDRALRMGMWAASGNHGPVARSLEVLAPLFEHLRGALDRGSDSHDLELALFSVHALFTHAFLWRRAHVELLGENLDDPQYADRVKDYLIRTSLELLSSP